MSRGSVYRAKADAQASIAAVDVKAAEATISTAIAQMQLFLKQAELNIKNQEVMAQLRVAAADAGGKLLRPGSGSSPVSLSRPYFWIATAASPMSVVKMSLKVIRIPKLLKRNIMRPEIF